MRVFCPLYAPLPQGRPVLLGLHHYYIEVGNKGRLPSISSPRLSIRMRQSLHIVTVFIYHQQRTTTHPLLVSETFPPIFRQIQVRPLHEIGGGASALAQAGLPQDHIQDVGRWSSEAFKTYIRDHPVLRLPLQRRFPLSIGGHLGAEVSFGVGRAS